MEGIGVLHTVEDSLFPFRGQKAISGIQGNALRKSPVVGRDPLPKTPQKLTSALFCEML
jgi:hypothetical protein